MKTTSTITSKGQVTVPIAIRRKLGLKQGDPVEFIVEGERTVMRRVRSGPSVFRPFIGAWKGKGVPNSVEAINRWFREMRDED